MRQEEFEKLIDRNKYQVFVLMSHAALFLSKHPWVVINKKGEAWLVPGAVSFDSLKATIEEALKS